MTQMNKIKHLEKAPIKEAVFDIRVVTDASFKVASFDRSKESLSNRFPNLQIREGIRVTFEIGPAKVAPPKAEDLAAPGYIFRSKDGAEILQFRTDGFTFNRLPPYTSYDELIPHILNYWDLYNEIAKPKLISRIALRFINSIPIGKGEISYKQFIRGGIDIPPELPQEVSSYFGRITLEQREMDIAAHVTQQIITEDNGDISLLLDIDAFKRIQGKPTREELTTYFLRLRQFKNEVFFNYLTETALKELE